MRGEESGKARKVILLALLCASSAAAPVVALRRSPAVETPAQIEESATARPEDPPQIGDAGPFEIEVSVVKPVEPVPVPPPPQRSLEDRLRGVAMG
ncbi:MAG: hypothetical protein AAB074_14185 [Planctomycetota bacterium]